MSENHSGCKEWRMAAQICGGMPSFNAVKEGKAPLTIKQAMVLFDAAVKVRREKIRKIYNAQWNYIERNEMLVLQSLHYNGGNTFIGTDTSFYENFKEYIKNKRKGDIRTAQEHLKICVYEVKYRSNAKNIRGLQKRRNSEAAILDTYSTSGY